MPPDSQDSKNSQAAKNGGKARLYVGNLPFVVEDHQLVALFGENGRKVRAVQIPREPATGRSKGFAFVEMDNLTDARGAMEALNGHRFLGRPLVVSEAREGSPPSDNAILDRNGKIHRLRKN